MTYYKCGSIHPTQNSNVVVDTASGAIANFQTPLAMPLVKTKFDVNAKQDLHGQSGPYPAGGSAQIWDEEWELGTIITSTGEDSPSSTKIRSVGYISVLPETTYYYANANGATIFYYETDHTYISYNSISANKTFTTPANCAYIRFTPVTNYGTTYKNDISINYPDTDTAYHPYSNICPIDGVSAVNIYQRGKNLLDNAIFNDASSYYVVNENGSITVLQTDNRGWSSIQNIMFLKKGTYIISRTIQSGVVQIRTSLDNYSANFVSSDGLKITFTLSDDCYIKIKLDAGATDEYPITDNFQIELGTATSHEPYNGTTEVINLGDTYYGGKLEINKNSKRRFKVTHNIAVYDLSTLQYTTEDGWDSWLIYRAERAESNPSSPVGKLCNCCPEYSYAGSQINRPHYYVSAGAFVMYLPENTYRNGILQYTYPLETPYYVDIPDGQPIKSLPGINNIYADTGDTSLQFRKIG